MGTTVEKWYVKYAWIIFFVVGLLNVIAAPINLLGNPPNPPSPEAMTGLTLAEVDAQIPGMLGYISSISVQLGNFLLLTGVLIMGIAAIPFKKGERWEWYVFWILPVFILIQLANSRGGFLWQADAAFLVVILAGLLLSYRKFFPKEPETP
jgi:hypothetical protein